DHTYPGAAASLREGWRRPSRSSASASPAAVPHAAERTRSRTSNGLVGHFLRNVRRWRNGRMLVRWVATGLQGVGRTLRRLRGHRELAALIRALDRISMDTRKE